MTAHRAKILALVMLPVFVLGTLPQSACICADGHRKAACPKLKGGGEKRGRSCCAGKSREQVGQPLPVSGIGVKVAGCCRVVIEGPPATAIVKPSSGTDKASQVATSECVVAPRADVSFRPVLSLAVYGQPPPRDAVFLYSRLTI